MSQRIAGIVFIVWGLVDVSWAVSVKYADGYTGLGWSLLPLPASCEITRYPNL